MPKKCPKWKFLALQVPNLKVEVKAVPIDSDLLMNSSLGGSRSGVGPSGCKGGPAGRRAEVDGMTFGGQRPPDLESHKYEVTVKDKMFYHAITVQKAFDNYSFEELRYASPALRRPSESMLVRLVMDDYLESFY